MRARTWTILGVVLGIGLLHVPGVLGSKRGCPFGYDRASTPEAREVARKRFSAAHAGTTPARSRPALGFVLDETTREDVLAWARRNGARCVAPKHGPDLECLEVPPAAVPERMRGSGIESLWLNFGLGGELVSVTAVRRASSPDEISESFALVTREIEAEAGDPASRDRDASAARLEQGALQQASAEYRFRDYYALARETNLGSSYVLTEEYRSLASAR
jgi:hypothetical protein